MDAKSVLQADLSRRGVRAVGDLSESDIVDLTLRYAVWIPVETYVDARRRLLAEMRACRA